jgi:hypothetical protein
MCYYVETITYTDPLFENVDATYILHLESNEDRYEEVKRQLKMYPPTKFVHIVFNKGFKNCRKPHVYNSTEDLADGCMYIMKDAQKYNTILLLEDDFMFNPNVHEHTQKIDEFVSTHSHFIYRLGCVPYIQFPYNSYTYFGISVGSHAIMLSKSVRDKIISNPPKMDWDIYLQLLTINYIYHTPICYQLFPITENQKNWGVGSTWLSYGAKIQIKMFQLLKLDCQTEPGYRIMYVISKIIPFLMLLYVFQKIFFIFKYHKRN